ncbi:MAG: TonB-dependent receptor, partial [Fulvivirga sp.]|nr:TonB-dependent receptor [Fulvivirga sp.]
VDRSEVVRGAASLQYGTQFGGLLNFVMKKGPEDEKLQTTFRNTVGSYGFYNTFTSVGGTVGHWNYYSFFQYKRGDGWRENSTFDSKMAYGAVEFEPSDRFKTSVQYTFLDYLAQQPGGLTDAEFRQNPCQSKRNRNWFAVNWNLIAHKLDYKFTDQFRLNIRNFALIASKDALGNLGRIDRPDVEEEERNLFSDEFNNYGSELRFIYNYNLFGQPAVALLGGRYYKGFTDRKQGLANASSAPDFEFLNPNQLEDSDYDFPNENISVFAENIFNVTNRFSITPGARFEHINTKADGYYTRTTLTKDPVTGQAVDSMYNIYESRESIRTFMFFGLGLSYKFAHSELYANFSQNYKSINFNDIRVNNPNLIVDENIQDEFGYNFDLGWRGQEEGRYNFDISLFYLRYNDRISTVQVKDTTNFRLLRYRSNIADAHSYGIEAFGELDIFEYIGGPANSQLNWFANLSLINSAYLSSVDFNTEKAIRGNELELVPPLTLRTGLSFIKDRFRFTYQFSYVEQHYTDATNAVFDPTAVAGIIPTYHVMDLSASYQYKFAKLEASVNNLTDNHYFTRRATGYPGPGIIPADGRTFYLTLQLQF